MFYFIALYIVNRDPTASERKRGIRDFPFCFSCERYRARYGITKLLGPAFLPPATTQYLEFVALDFECSEGE